MEWEQSMYKVWNGSRACGRYGMGAEHGYGMEWEQSMYKVWNGSRASEMNKIGNKGT